MATGRIDRISAATGGVAHRQAGQRTSVAESELSPDESLSTATRTYAHLMRAASGLFQFDELTRLAPMQRMGESLVELGAPDSLDAMDPLAATELLAYDFLARGGKYARPFMTLAAYDALSGGCCTQGDGAARVEGLPDFLRRSALAIETFHKASLVHDDIEDDDEYRYGKATLHHRYGISTAINVGDYLIGLGYRLVAREAAAMGSEACADIIEAFSDAHVRLAEGQGAELAWRDARNKRLAPPDALKIYALKTSPAFEAALVAGVRLAGPNQDLRQPIRLFARNLGVAFQILNDLNDWEGDEHNKLAAGGDVTGGRPTLLLALALENLPPLEQEALLRLLAADCPASTAARVDQVRRLYQGAGVFQQARQLVDRHHQRAVAIAREIEGDQLRSLLYFLVDTVLERSSGHPPSALATPNGATASSAAAGA